MDIELKKRRDSSQAKNRSAWFEYLVTALRSLLFFAFCLLSLRLIMVTLHAAPPVVAGLVGGSTVLIAVLTWYRTDWALAGFLVGLPIVSGLQVIGFMNGLPLLSTGFAALFLSWFVKRRFWEQKGLASGSTLENLVDILSAIILVSLLGQLLRFPADVIWLSLSAPWQGQDEVLYGITGSYVLLQGLFFYRLLVMRSPEKRIQGWLRWILSLQAAAILGFSGLQLLAHIPMPIEGKGIVFSPFDDIHSYGSALVLLFFVFLCLSLEKQRFSLFSALLAGLLVLCILLSGSFGTLGATFLVGSVFLWRRFRLGKVVVSGGICLVCGWFLLVEINPGFLKPMNASRSILAGRYADGLKLDSLIGKLNGRILSADQALGLIQEFPITGSGVGTFYRISRYYHWTETPHPGRIENAHNYYLQFGAELGLPALLIFLLILYGSLRIGFQDFDRAARSPELVKGLLYGLSAYLVTMLSGHPLLLSNQQFLFWFALAAVRHSHEI